MILLYLQITLISVSRVSFVLFSPCFVFLLSVCDSYLLFVIRDWFVCHPFSSFKQFGMNNGIKWFFIVDVIFVFWPQCEWKWKSMRKLFTFHCVFISSIRLGELNILRKRFLFIFLVNVLPIHNNNNSMVPEHRCVYVSVQCSTINSINLWCDSAQEYMYPGNKAPISIFTIFFPRSFLFPLPGSLSVIFLHWKFFHLGNFTISLAVGSLFEFPPVA